MKAELDLLIQENNLNRPLHRLGSGNFGRVFEAIYDNQRVVYKIMKHAVPSSLFHNEVNILKKLNHPCIPKYYKHCEYDNIQLIIMEKSPGMELYDMLNIYDIPYHKKVVLGYNILDTLVYLHNNCILYLDLKPDNIMVDPRTGNHQIIDFGLSVCLPDPNTLIKGKCGTKCFAAPEVIRDEQYGLSADIYSYGMLLFVLFTEKNPCKPSLRSSYLKRYTSPNMYRFIMKCLNEIPRNRYSAHKNMTVYPINDNVFETRNSCCFPFFFCFL